MRVPRGLHPSGLDRSVRVGIAFGLTSGIITTLGLLVGLAAGTSSRTAVLGGIFTIAVADAMSDALGIHISRESEGHDTRDVWVATFATFGAKLVTALSFAVPVLLLGLGAAVVASILWGAGGLVVLSVDLARRQGVPAAPIVGEHLGVAVLVVGAAQLVGVGISSVFG